MLKCQAAWSVVILLWYLYECKPVNELMYLIVDAGTMSINENTNFMQLFLKPSIASKWLHLVKSLSFLDDLLWRGIKESKLNVNLSQEPLRVKLIATYYAFVLKDTGIKKKYYFIKSHSTVSLALVTNVCLHTVCVSQWKAC